MYREFNRLQKEIIELRREVEELKYVPPPYGGPAFREAKESYDNCAGTLDAEEI
jgi:hypothetical protein